VNGSLNIIGENNGSNFNGEANLLTQNLVYSGTLPSPFGSFGVLGSPPVSAPYVYFLI
jgi:hypothetical protein